MYVKTFVGESLDDTLKQVKKELGPDAIILKTVSGKGIKGSFKKQIQITAAVSERSYEKKSTVDHALGDDYKDKFYNAPSEYVGEKIDEYNSNNNQGYTKLGLNKTVNSLRTVGQENVKKASGKVKEGLDHFINSFKDKAPQNEFGQDSYTENNFQNENMNDMSNRGHNNNHSEHENYASQVIELNEKILYQKSRLEILENKFSELNQNLIVQKNKDDEIRGIINLRHILRSMDVDDKIINNIIKKAEFELTKEEIKDEDSVLEFALRDMISMIQTKLPLFSTLNLNKESVITVIISEAASGQTSMALKLAVLQENSAIIRFRSNESADTVTQKLATQIYNIDTIQVKHINDLITNVRKHVEASKQIVIDLKACSEGSDQTKKIIETLHRTFSNIEVLINISAINSEIYNRKIISKYKDFCDGIILSFMDQCLSYGHLLNLQYYSGYLPFKFFGTGPVVPDDIEAASPERIIGEMFNLQ